MHWITNYYSRKKDDQPKDTSYTMPPGHVFVLGDNRSASVDSRNYGMIPVSSIIGIGKQAWFSDSKTSDIRWMPCINL